MICARYEVTDSVSRSRVLGRFPFDQKFRKFRVKSEWKGHFPEYHFGILGVPRELVPIFRKIGITGAAFHSTKNSGYSGWGSEWNRQFPEFHSEILGVPREVGLKFRKIGITGKYCSIRHMEYPKFHSGIFC